MGEKSKTRMRSKSEPVYRSTATKVSDSAFIWDTGKGPWWNSKRCVKWSPWHSGLISLGPTHEDEIALTLCLESRQAMYPQSQTGCVRDMPSGYQWFICFPVVWGGVSWGCRACLWHYFPRCHQQKGLYLWFLPLMTRAKVLGPAGALASQSRPGRSVLHGPRETGLAQGPWGPVWKVASLISLWSGSSWRIWEDKEWFVLHMCFRLLLKGAAKTLHTSTVKSSEQTSFKQPQRVYGR